LHFAQLGIKKEEAFHVHNLAVGGCSAGKYPADSDQRPQVDFPDDGWELEKILKANFPQMHVPESPEERNMFREVIDNADQPIVQDRLH
jgi:hypothetical protein